MNAFQNNGNNYSIDSKLKFINETVIEYNVIINGQMIEFITKYCNNFKELVIKSCRLIGFNDKQIQEFGEKFSKSLVSIRIPCNDSTESDDYSINKLVQSLSNFVLNICLIHLMNLSIITSKPNNHFKKLEEVVIKRRFKSIEEMKIFIDLNMTLKELTRFVNLKTLGLSLISLNDDSFEKGLKNIANECKKLEKLELIIRFKYYNYESFSGQLFEILGKFESLISLDLSSEYPVNNYF